MIREKMEKAFNDQINAELNSYYIYLSMSAWFTSKNLDGFAGWMQAQAQEEMVHAMKFYNHIHERNGRVRLQPIEGPKAEWNSPREAFEAAYKHEQYITGRIHDLVKMAMAENDFASNSFLQWFVSEQVEEEASTGAVVDQLKTIADYPGGLFMLDRELGKRGSAAGSAE
jgi:ferritin